MGYSESEGGSEPILERHISDRAFVGHYFAALAVGSVVATGCFAAGAGVFSPLGILAVVGVFLYSRVARAGTTYRLFAERIEIESGLLSRKIENVELYRVRDVGLRQSIAGRIGGFGDVYIHSTDSSTPALHVRAIDAPQEFYQEVRQLVSRSRAGSRTMIVEEGASLPER
jgi:uncharacterized membrane protein YdbT with pleckstrin-like domain